MASITNPAPATGVTEPQSPPSDDGGERPVRQQLKETSIKSVPTTNESASRRKRSFDGPRAGRNSTADYDDNGESRRKRSRDCTPLDDTEIPTSLGASPSIKSEYEPKRSTTTETLSSTVDEESSKVLNKKRSREQLEDPSYKSGTKNDTVQDRVSTNTADATFTTDGEREKKRHRDNSQERETKTDNAFAASAFGKAAGASPFAPLGSTQDSTNKPASTSAFASSSLASFAGSEHSPFGTLGASSPSVFKSAPTVTGSFASPPTTGFGALGNGFSGVGGGFAAAAKPGGLTSFASSNAPAILGGAKAKAFGVEDSDGDDSYKDDDEEDTTTFEASKTDERFYEQTIETGEEEESTLFSCKAKLFSFVNKEWKERGIGTFKLNAKMASGGYTHGRMIMRADGAMRVMLNSPIFDGMNYGDTDNNAPSTKQILLTGTEEGRNVPMLLRTGSEALALELHEQIKELLGKSD